MKCVNLVPYSGLAPDSSMPNHCEPEHVVGPAALYVFARSSGSMRSPLGRCRVRHRGAFLHLPGSGVWWSACHSFQPRLERSVQHHSRDERPASTSSFVRRVANSGAQ